MAAQLFVHNVEPFVKEVLVTNGARVFQPVYENGLENPFSVCFARQPFLHTQASSRETSPVLDKVCDEVCDKVCAKVHDKVFGDGKVTSSFFRGVAARRACPSQPFWRVPQARGYIGDAEEGNTICDYISVIKIF